MASDVTPVAAEDLAQLTAGAVRAELARAGRSGTAAAEVLGMSQAAISRRLRAETPFTSPELLTLARWLGIPAGRLLGDTP
jgi:hypothetical protein